MTDRAHDQVATVIRLRTPAHIIRETASEIGAWFPCWHVWHSAESGTWNAYRKNQEPHFGPMGEDVRVFMVSAYDVATLVALLEGQALADMAMEFPDWAGRTGKLGRLVRLRP